MEHDTIFLRCWCHYFTWTSTANQKLSFWGSSGQSEAQLLGTTAAGAALANQKLSFWVPLGQLSLAFTLNLPSCNFFLNSFLSYSLFKVQAQHSLATLPKNMKTFRLYHLIFEFMTFNVVKQSACNPCRNTLSLENI